MIWSASRERWSVGSARCPTPDTWVRLLLGDESFVGIFVYDSKGDFFQYAFASKEKYGRELLGMKRGDHLRLFGNVQRVGSDYIFMVEEIRK